MYKNLQSQRKKRCSNLYKHIIYMHLCAYAHSALEKAFLLHTKNAFLWSKCIHELCACKVLQERCVSTFIHVICATLQGSILASIHFSSCDSLTKSAMKNIMYELQQQFWSSYLCV